MTAPEFGIVIPACDEEECIGVVLEELLRMVGVEKFAIAVGVNGSTDSTAGIAARFPVSVAETRERGYGFGCQAAIDLLERTLPPLRGYIFFAGDGASDPADIPALVQCHEGGSTFVLGTRTRQPGNWPVMSIAHVMANVALGGWCAALTGKWFTDLGPLRLIDRSLFHKLALREMTFGWTIEAQVGAAVLGAQITEVRVRERPRIAGRQKVSRVAWRRTFTIACEIVAAGWRARKRSGVPPAFEPKQSAGEFVTWGAGPASLTADAGAVSPDHRSSPSFRLRLAVPSAPTDVGSRCI